MENKTDRARIFGEIIAIIGIVVAIALSVWAYNTRYDSSAQASDEIQMSFSSSNNSNSVSITASAGSVWYGAWQKTGKSGSSTSYTVYYKKTSASCYGAAKILTFKYNGEKYAQGDWRLARSKYSQKYDIKITRTSNKSTSSSLRFDWSVDSYNSTGS